MTTEELLKLVSARQAYFTSRGIVGRELYVRLAADEELPASFREPAAAAIYGLSTHAMKQRRARGMKPDYVRVSHNSVLYTRASIFTDLADRFVEVPQ